MRSFDWQTAPLDRSLSLEASAGTGKTYTLEHLVYRLVAEAGMDLEEILVVTFTNKAAREMEDRIRKILKEERAKVKGVERERLQRAYRDFDRSSIFTIHGFCRHVIQTYSFEIGVPFQMELGQNPARDRRDIRDWFRRHEKSRDPLILWGFRSCRNRGYDGTQGVIDRILDLQSMDLPYGTSRLHPEPAAIQELVDLLEQGAGSSLSGKLKDLDFLLDKNNLRQQLVNEKLITSRMGQATVDSFLKQWELLAEKNFHPLEWLRLSSGILKMIEKGKPQDSPFWTTRNALLDYLEDCNRKWGQDWALTLEWAFMLRVLEDLDRERQESILDRTGYRFDDLIRLVHGSLTAGDERSLSLLTALRENYRIVLIDEFQDTDRLQWEIFQRIFKAENHRFILIGDPKQSIYRFRGADLNIYNRAVSQIPPENRFQLDRNYRSTPELVEIFNNLFARMFRPFRDLEAPVFYHPVGSSEGKAPKLTCDGATAAPLILLDLPPTEKANLTEARLSWMETIASTLAELTGSGRYQLDGHPVHGGHIAVLMEGNAHCVEMQQLLQHRGIPSVISGERIIFESEAMAIVQAFLRLLADRSDRSSLSELMLSPLFSLTAEELLLAGEQGLLDRLIQELDSRLKRHRDLERLFRGFLAGGENLCKQLSREDQDPPLVRILGQPGGERLQTDLFHLLEIFEQQKSEGSLDFPGLLHLSMSREFQSGLEEQKKVRLEKEGEVVQIMTHHSSKGLQFPILFFAGGFYQNILNQKSTVFRFNQDGEIHFCGSKDEEIKSRAEQEEWLEKLKLYYVALTRTESRLYLPLLEEWKGKPKLLRLYGELVEEPCSEAEASGAIKRQLLEEFPQWVKVQNPPDEGGVSPSAVQLDLELKELRNAPFGGRYDRLSSFSSLVRQEVHTPFLVPEDLSEREEETSVEDSPVEAEDLPRNLAGGKNLGNLLHLCFEEMDFSWAAEDLETFAGRAEMALLLERCAGRYFPGEWFRGNRNHLYQLIHQTLNAPLEPLGGRRLYTLTDGEKRHELEFHMRVREGTFPFGGERWSLEKGYLKGFLDLVFLHEDRYYILDWKSTANPAHPRQGGYGPGDLDRLMGEHRYDLQALIYWAALSRLLRKILGKDFSPDRMGGVFYLFLRGMDEPEGGIWFHRPEPGDLAAFEDLYLEEDPQ